jgi:hypothetical protein
VGLLRALARDYCADGSEKADIVERLVEVGRKASRCRASMTNPDTAMTGGAASGRRCAHAA